MKTPKQKADEIFDFSKRTIKYFIKDIDNDTLYQLAKQISLTQIRYTSDRIDDNVPSLEIFRIKQELEKL
jgi:hypothetical protein